MIEIYKQFYKNFLYKGGLVGTHDYVLLRVGVALRLWLITEWVGSVEIQLPTFAFTRLLNKPYENEVTLTGQNPPLKCCQHIEIQYTVRKRVDLLMLKILGL